MAKNFLNQILGLTGFKAPDANGHYDPSVYIDESSSVKPDSGVADAGQTQSTELTGVAKYLAKKQPKEETTELTGVAKYLAKKQQEEQKTAAAEQAAQANMTGVAKYLAELDARKKPAQKKPAPAKPINTAPATGVDKYLARQKEATPVIKQAQTPEEAPKEPKPTAKTKAPEESPAVKKQEEAKADKIKEPEPEATEVKTEAKTPAPAAQQTTTSLINLSENASQCQAATLKGTQCRRKSNLETINRTINKQKYKFAVCSQHNNNEFTPLAELLQND